MLDACESKLDIIKNFVPSWFAAVMGTGILAVDSLLYSAYLPILKDVAVALFYFNVLLFFIFLIPWVLRWIMFKDNALADLKHPVLSAFYPTIAVGCLVLGADFINIGHDMFWGEIFWTFGAIGMFLFSLIVPFYMFKSESIKLEHVNPGWYIPPVGLIVIPIAGSLIMPHLTGVWHELVVIINYFGWGAGFFLYLALLAVVIYRFILHHPLPSAMAPTVWINLGPIGAGIVALINMVNNSPFITIKEPFYIFSLIFWGFGLWWSLMAIIMTLYYVKKLKLPYAMSWWAFIFPLGVYIASTHLVYKIFGFGIVDYIGFGLYWLLFFFWIVTLIKTINKVYTGELFKEK